jgi:hypothetical protein
MLELGTATDQLEQQARLLAPTIAATAVSILMMKNQEARNKLSVGEHAREI